MGTTLVGHSVEAGYCPPETLVGHIVFCKVRGNYYDHLVKAKNEKRGYLIANNHGHVNGWTHQIFGIVRGIKGGTK